MFLNITDNTIIINIIIILLSQKKLVYFKCVFFRIYDF